MQRRLLMPLAPKDKDYRHIRFVRLGSATVKGVHILGQKLK